MSDKPYVKFLKSKKTKEEIEEIEEQRARRAVLLQPGKRSGYTYRLAPNPFERKKDEPNS